MRWLSKGYSKTEPLGECLHLCLHRCRNCELPVSQICGCNTEDPNSSNPMHRVHVDWKRCKNRISIDCHYCSKSAISEEALNCHIRAMYTYSKWKPQNFSNIFVTDDGDINANEDSDWRKRRKMRCCYLKIGDIVRDKQCENNGFICQKCGKSFAKKYNLTRNNNRIHHADIQ